MKPKFIAHRGNLDGKDSENENKAEHILQAIRKGYEVEVDVWLKNDFLFLGHDLPENRVDIGFLKLHAGKLWIHCKNIEALSFFNKKYKKLNYFYHTNEDYALTSRNYIWTFPGSQLVPGAVAVMPETGFVGDLQKCAYICTDNVYQYEKILK